MLMITLYAEQKKRHRFIEKTKNSIFLKKDKDLALLRRGYPND